MENKTRPDSIPGCDDIVIPIEENGQGLDHMRGHGGDSKHLRASESGSYSFSDTSLQKASNGSSPYSEGLRSSPPSNTTNWDSTSAAELPIRRPSMRKSKVSNPKSGVMEAEIKTSSNLGRESSGSRGHGEEDNDNNEDKDAGGNHDGDDDAKKNHGKPPLGPLQIVYKRAKFKDTLKSIDVIIEWILFVGSMAVLIASLYAHELKIRAIWGSEIWKWCVLFAVVFCGRLVTKWARDGLVFLIESRYLFNEKVVYFVPGVKQSVRVVIWLALVLLAWFLLIDRGVKRSRKPTRVLKYITRALAATLIAAFLWTIKTLLVKLISASFHVKKFFSRIREAIVAEYVFWTLAVPRSVCLARSDSKAGLSTCCSFKILKWKSKEHNEITMKRLQRMRSERMPVSTIDRFAHRIRSSKLSIISGALDERQDDGYEQGKQQEIASKDDMELAASQIFQNVKSPDANYIAKEDLEIFKSKENEDILDDWFKEVAEEGKITDKALTNWAVNILDERDHLSHSLRDTKAALEKLNRVLSGIVLVLIIIVWLPLTGFATTKLLLVLSFQIVLAAFSCRTLFEAIIFVFIMDPFDVGDRCVIDGVMMVVEEMDIMKTSFLRYDNEMIYYPNAVLASKPITNFNRSPDKMGDNVNFDIDVSTPSKTIDALRDKIKEHIENTPQHWHPDHSVQIKEIENMNKMKMVLFVNHKMNFQDYLEKMNRRTELMLALKGIFEDLGIKYHLLPQEIGVTYNGSAAAPTTSTLEMQSRSVL